MSHVWPLLSCKLCLVRELLDENERMECMVVMESGVRLVTDTVTKGLPLTRKNRRLDKGMSKVTPRSLKEEITCFSCESWFVFMEVEIVISGSKT